jgi:hypothetical protein
MRHNSENGCRLDSTKALHLAAVTVDWCEEGKRRSPAWRTRNRTNPAHGSHLRKQVEPVTAKAPGLRRSGAMCVSSSSSWEIHA